MKIESEKFLKLINSYDIILYLKNNISLYNILSDYFNTYSYTNEEIIELVKEELENNII